MRKWPGILLWLGVLTLPLAAADSDYPAARLGENAFQAGDYVSAVRLFREYRTAAANDPVASLDAARRLTAALLRAGELDQAAAVLAELPETATADPAFGLLQGDLLLLRHDYAGARARFAELLQTRQLSGADYCRILAGLGAAELRAGDYRAAAATYEKLEGASSGAPEWAFPAWSQRVRALLLGGELEEAARIYGTGERFTAPEEQASRRVLELKLLLARKEYAEFRKRWTALRPELPREPDAQLAELAQAAAEQALAAQDPAAAAAYFGDAFEFADEESAQRDYLRKRINAQAAAGDPAAAANSLERYLEFFPRTPDRGALLLELARLRTAAGDRAGALATYRRVLDEGTNVNPPERCRAALEGGLLAAKHGEAAAAEHFFRALTRLGEGADQQKEGNFRLGELWFGQGKFKEAAAEFAAAAAAPGWRGRGLYWQLQSELKLADYQAVLATATRLQELQDPEFSADAGYYRALALEKTDFRSGALELYANFIREQPNSKLAPTACAAAAELALALKDYPAAVGFLKTFQERFPEHPRLAAELYQLQRAALLARDPAAATTALDRLQALRPDSEYLPAALFLQFDYLRAREQWSEALALLERIAALPGTRTPETAAQLAYDRATVLLQLDDAAGATAALKEVLERYVSTPAYPDAALLAANLAADSGDYQRALSLYERVLKLRPTGTTAAVLRGRMADCAYSLYATTLEPELLKRAQTLYQELAASAPESGLRLQSLYKYGKCSELAEQDAAALAAYQEVLYRALELKRQGDRIDPVWPSKAAYSAAQLYLRRGTPAGGREALRVLRVFESLKLETGEDLTALLETIRKKYRLN